MLTKKKRKVIRRTVNGEHWQFEELGESLWYARRRDPIVDDAHFTFDCKTIFSIHQFKEVLTPEQLEIFDRNWPYWRPDREF